VPAAVAPTALVPLPKRIPFDVKVPTPIPPLPTEITPVKLMLGVEPPLLLSGDDAATDVTVPLLVVDQLKAPLVPAVSTWPDVGAVLGHEYVTPFIETRLPDEFTWNCDVDPTESIEVGVDVPIPTLPCIIAPLAGAAVPLKVEPMVRLPFTSSLLPGALCPIPTFCE